MGKQFVRSLLVLSALVWGPVASVAYADSFVIAEATLDWTGFSIRVSDGLSIDSVVVSHLVSRTSAETRHGVTEIDMGAVDSSAGSHYSNALGEATANSGVENGALSSRSEAASFGGPAVSSASADAFASTAFWLYGSGVGVLTVEVPYELLVEATVNLPVEATVNRSLSTDIISATASVSLQLGSGWFTSDSISWDSSRPSVIRTGTLVLSKEFVEPVWGPLVFIGAGASTKAVTAVPEPSALAFLTFGAFSVVCLRRKTTNKVG
jgi:PEP-CTERM motif